MARIRTDNVFGTITNDPLTAAGTTLNSAGLANLDVVASPDEALITLDPNRANGAPEIVVVTAHTASATSATITRGAFGTAARQHVAGTEWVHGPIGGNSTTLVDDAADQGDFPPMGEWEDYTPSNTNVTVGNGTETARFTRIGRTITYVYTLEWGSTTSYGGTIQVGLPVPSAVTGGGCMGSARMLDAGTRHWLGSTVVDETNGQQVFVIQQNSSGSGLVSGSNPFTWAEGDFLSVTGSYEAAA